MYVATSSQIREADRIQIEAYQYPGILLMDTAGRKAACHLLQAFPDRSEYLILAGPGNNGGDGWVIARYLQLWGQRVRVIVSHPPDSLKGDAQTAFQMAEKLGINWSIFDPGAEAPAGGSLLIDALLGTGISGPLRPPVQEIIEWARGHQAVAGALPVVAVDLPSGLDADTGATHHAVLPAALTLTFQLPKVCHVVSPAAQVCGKVEVLDIGLYPAVTGALGIHRMALRDGWVREQYRRRASDTHKGTFGHVMVVGGSRDMAGAPALSAFASLQSGAGLSTLFVPDQARMAAYGVAPELMVVGTAPDLPGEHLTEAHVDQVLPLLSGKAVVLVGPGMGQAAETGAFLARLLPQIQVPLILDADALNLLSGMPELWGRLPRPLIITPHPGEMRRLTGSEAVLSRRLEEAERFARDKDCFVVLKGAGTLIACPDGQTYINPTGNAGMATAGSGDVLGGLMAAWVAQGYAPGIAAALAVYLHGRAGDLLAARQGMEGITARLLAGTVSEALKTIVDPQSLTS